MPVPPILLVGFAVTHLTTPNVHERYMSTKDKIIAWHTVTVMLSITLDETLLMSLTRTYHEAFEIRLISTHKKNTHTHVAVHYCINMALVFLCEAKVSQTLQGCRSSILSRFLRLASR